MCSSIGFGCAHSVDVFVLLICTILRDLANLSQMIHVNMITAQNEIRDPIEDTTFQVAKASG